ncbi:MAG: hypothetical protein RL748_4437 [Pseudomonadota bacterium]|jgi:hypothetical protein
MEQDGRVRRRKEALRVFSEQPNYFSQEIRDAILSNLVIPGMTPYDVHLAVGAFTFRVSADPKVWPPGANPWDVLWAQSAAPDQSAISLMFESDIQLADVGHQRFLAHFKAGRVLVVEHLLPLPEVQAEAMEEVSIDMTTIIPGAAPALGAMVSAPASARLVAEEDMTTLVPLSRPAATTATPAMAQSADEDMTIVPVSRSAALPAKAPAAPPAEEDMTTLFPISRPVNPS